MKLLIQRVTQASVSVGGEILGSIDHGLLTLVGFGKSDNEGRLTSLADKLVNLRIFPNEQGRFDKSVLDVHGGILLVPQFTLYADTSKGRRPEFFEALAPEPAAELFKSFVSCVETFQPQQLAQGSFGANMQVSLINDGPVTIALEN